MNKLKIGYFADGQWSHQAFQKILLDDSLKLEFIRARYDAPDPILKEIAYKFDIDFHFTVMKKYLIHRYRLLNNSYLLSSFVFEQFLRRLIISKNFSEDILFLKKLKNFIYWVNRTIFTSILKLEKANVNVIKRLLDNPWTPMYRSLYPQYDKFSKIFFKFLISSEREDAAKKIYFWWIPICYSLEHPSGCGQRMALKNYEKYLELK